MKVYQLPNGRIHEGDWLQADLLPGYTLAIVDGPYGMGKGGWDRVKVDDLAAWYTPHIERLSGLMAASATVYLWNTAEGWARLDPVMRAAGWTFCVLVTWDKGAGGSPMTKGFESMRSWPDVTEVCAMYHRSAHVKALRFHLSCCGKTMAEVGRSLPWHASLVSRWLEWPNTVGSCLPTRDRFCDLWRAMGYPESTTLSAWRSARGPAFRCPDGLSNVWHAPMVAGPERLQGTAGGALHPCQKPLAFAERMIRASSRPGERVLVPFGGTNREAVAIEWMTRRDPAEARQYDACELNQDGPDYIAPVLAQIRGEDHRPGMHRQAPLFGGAA